MSTTRHGDGIRTRLAYHTETVTMFRPWAMLTGVVTINDVRAVTDGLPRSYEALVRDRVKFRVGRIVYLAFSRDETIMGFAFPKEERDGLIASDTEKFLMPSASDLRYNWVCVRLSAIDLAEMRELVLDAWRMVVPRTVAEAHLGHSVGTLRPGGGPKHHR